jgi:hypothetical protein
MKYKNSTFPKCMAEKGLFKNNREAKKRIRIPVRR